MATLRGIGVLWAVFSLLLPCRVGASTSVECLQALEGPRLPVYRVLQGPRPTDPLQLRADEFQWGTKILYVDGPPPAQPVFVNGLVLVSTLEETRHFVGIRTPLLEVREAQERIEDDKGAEALLIQAAAPGAMPRTEILDDRHLGAARSRPENLSALEWDLRRRYPRGFVIKPRSSFSTDGKFPSEQTPFLKLWSAYRTGAALRVAELQAQGMDPADIHLQLKSDPSYPGRILDAALIHPSSLIVQERVEIATTSGDIPEEYRVHVYGGRVLDRATQHRWEDYRHIQPRRLALAEAFVQGVIDRLPRPYDRMTYAVDVVFTKKGNLQLFETNAGWESQYGYADTDLWVANLMAERYRGEPTPFLRLFRRFEAAEGMEPKIVLLRRLLRHPLLREAVEEGSAVTEVLSQARRALLAEFRPHPSPEDFQKLLGAIREFKLGPYLTWEEITFLTPYSKAYGVSARKFRDVLGIVDQIDTI